MTTTTELGTVVDDIREGINENLDGTVQVHEDNSGGVYLTKGGKTWGLGDGAWLAGNGSMGNSTALADASGWANGEWEPSEQDGHTRSTTDNLTLVATWEPCDCDCDMGALRIVRDDNGEFVGGAGAASYCGVQD